MSIFRVIAVCFLTIFPGWLLAQRPIFENSDFLKKANTAIDLTYDFEFDQAEDLLLELKSEEPAHPAPYFLLAFNRYWQTYISLGTRVFMEEIEGNLEIALEKAKDLKKQPEFGLEYTFFQFMTYAIRARINTMQKQWWPAVTSARKVIPYLKDGFEYKERRPEFYFSSGIYHYYAATYVQQHPVVKPFMIFFPNGDLELGLKEMRIAGEKSSFAQSEALYYLTDIYLNERQEYAEGLWAARKLHQMHPANPLFRANYAHALILNKKYEEAADELESIIQTFQQISGHEKENISSLQSDYTSQIMFRVWHYQGKLLFMGRQDFRGAIGAFQRSDELAAIAGLEKDLLLPANRFFTGRCYDSLGQRENAKEAYNQALKMDENNWIKDKIKACRDTPCPG